MAAEDSKVPVTFEEFNKYKKHMSSFPALLLFNVNGT
jgi:hypothetical protein